MPRQRAARSTPQLPVLLRLQALSEPAVQTYVSALRERYRQYLVPIEQGRKLIDQAMGATPLTDILYQTREERSVQ